MMENHRLAARAERRASRRANPTAPTTPPWWATARSGLVRPYICGWDADYDRPSEAPWVDPYFPRGAQAVAEIGSPPRPTAVAAVFERARRGGGDQEGGLLLSRYLWTESGRPLPCLSPKVGSWELWDTKGIMTVDCRNRVWVSSKGMVYLAGREGGVPIPLCVLGVYEELRSTVASRRAPDVVSIAVRIYQSPSPVAGNPFRDTLKWTWGVHNYHPAVAPLVKWLRGRSVRHSHSVFRLPVGSGLVCDVLACEFECRGPELVWQLNLCDWNDPNRAGMWVTGQNIRQLVTDQALPGKKEGFGVTAEGHLCLRDTPLCPDTHVQLFKQALLRIVDLAFDCKRGGVCFELCVCGDPTATRRFRGDAEEEGLQQMRNQELVLQAEANNYLASRAVFAALKKCE
ncbi:hypothetical protein VZT92_026544 [Zoarces viviparus]|uniref:Uncharacterized protein n=1 Tax=Zoarces viviparus TaxID=48416 RepID=A0AAW1E196_ZOAVI